MNNGNRKRVQVYILYNTHDLGSFKAMSPDMRNVCQGSGCTRLMLEASFLKNSDGVPNEAPDPDMCCHDCDLKVLQNEN